MIQIDNELIQELFDKAAASERKRMNYDLRTSAEDGSQRMLNALLPGTSVPVHRHPRSNENVICLKGRLLEIVFEVVSEFQKVQEVSGGCASHPSDSLTVATGLTASSESSEGSSAIASGASGAEGEVFPMAMESGDVVKRTRLVEKERIVLDPAVGNFGCVVPAGAWHTVEVLEPSVIYEAKDGKYGEDGSESFGTKTITKTKTEESASESCLGDLKEQITYLIGMERHSGSMEVCSPLYVSRMLNVPIEEVEEAMKEMEV